MKLTSLQSMFSSLISLLSVFVLVSLNLVVLKSRLPRAASYTLIDLVRDNKLSWSFERALRSHRMPPIIQDSWVIFVSRATMKKIKRLTCHWRESRGSCLAGPRPRPARSVSDPWEDAAWYLNNVRLNTVKGSSRCSLVPKQCKT